MLQNSFFLAFLVFFHIDTTYIKLEWNFENFFYILVHPSGQGILGQYVHLLKLGQYVAGTTCHWDNMSQDKMSPQYS